MVQRVQMLLEDDIDGGEADETVSFSLEGVEYEIDLSARNAEKLRNVVAPYVEAARRVGGRRRRGGSPAGRGRGSSSAEIREWARQNGWEIPDRGRIATEVRDAYAAAH
jgi:Lsr2